MYMRCKIAILDRNNNINTKQLGDKMVYSKSIGRYV